MDSPLRQSCLHQLTHHLHTLSPIPQTNKSSPTRCNSPSPLSCLWPRPSLLCMSQHSNTPFATLCTDFTSHLVHLPSCTAQLSALTTDTLHLSAALPGVLATPGPRTTRSCSTLPSAPATTTATATPETTSGTVAPTATSYVLNLDRHDD